MDRYRWPWGYEASDQIDAEREHLETCVACDRCGRLWPADDCVETREGYVCPVCAGKGAA